MGLAVVLAAAAEGLLALAAASEVESAVEAFASQAGVLVLVAVLG